MRWAGIVLVLALAGCAPRDAGFADVRRTISERIGRDVRWDPEERPGAPASAETRALLRRPLDADRAVQVALLNNAELAAQFEELGVARASLVGASLLPNLELEGAYRFGDDVHGAEYDVGAAVSLIDLLLLPQRRSVASAELKAARMRAAVTVLDLALATRRTFYAYQAAEQEAELRRTVLDAQAAAMLVAQRLLEAGNVNELEHAREQALYEEARVALAEAERRSRALRERMHALLGVSGAAATWTTARRLPEMPEDEDLPLAQVERRAIERSLDLEALRRGYEAASGRAALASASGWAPGLAVGVSAESEDGDLHVGPTVAVTIPLFDQGQGEAGRARARARMLEQRYEAAAVRIRAAARAARDELVTARERLVHHREVVMPLRARILEQTQLRYNAMFAGVFELLEARREQIEAGRTWIVLLRRYWMARAAVETLLAGRLAELDEPGFGTDAADLDGEGEDGEDGADRQRGGH